MHDENFKQPILLKFGVVKSKPLSSFSFRKLHRALIEFRDRDLQLACCELAGVESVGDALSFGYCCVDEHEGLQFHILGAFNRDGRLDCWVPVPEGKEIVLSYHDAKDKMISLADSYETAVRECLPRCKQLMEQHEKNPTIMMKALDKLRSIEFPLDIQVTIPSENETEETVLFRPTERLPHSWLRGVLLEEPQANASLHKGDFLDVKLIFGEWGRVVKATQQLLPDWTPTEDGIYIGDLGPSGGMILEDEEYDGRCRITLEYDPDSRDDCAEISVDIYTSEYIAYAKGYGLKQAYEKYEAIKRVLKRVLDFDTLECDEDLAESYGYIEELGDYIEYYKEK